MGGRCQGFFDPRSKPSRLQPLAPSPPGPGPCKSQRVPEAERGAGKVRRSSQSPPPGLPGQVWVGTALRRSGSAGYPQRGEGVLTQSPPGDRVATTQPGRAPRPRPIVRPCPSHSKPVCVRFAGPAAQLGVLQARIQTSSLFSPTDPGRGASGCSAERRGEPLSTPSRPVHTLSPRSWAGDAGCPVPSSV